MSFAGCRSMDRANPAHSLPRCEGLYDDSAGPAEGRPLQSRRQENQVPRAKNALGMTAIEVVGMADRR
jgi:hypothetical protein